MSVPSALAPDRTAIRSGWLFVLYFVFFAFSGGEGVAIAAAAASGISNEMTQKHVVLKKCSLAFVPFAGLVESKDFEGFTDSRRGITILASTLAVPYKAAVDGFTEPAFAAKGMELKSKTEFSLNGSPATLLKVLHANDGRKWGKWILVLGDQAKTVLVNGIFVSGDDKAAEDVLAFLKSAVPVSPGA